MRVVLFIVALCAAPLVCVAQEAVKTFGPAIPARSFTLRTTTDIDILAPTIEAFLATRPELGVRYEQWGSNDLFALSEKDCVTEMTGADIVISSGVHQIVKLVNDGCAATWVSPETLNLPDRLRWRDQLWGVSREPAVIVYNRTLVPVDEAPQSRFDLLDLLRPDQSPYAGRVATYDIEVSGLGYLFAFMDSQEASTFGALMEAFARSGAVATCCSAEIIGGVVSGEYLIAYNVLGSYAAEKAKSEPNLGIIAPADYTLMLSRAAYLPGNTANQDAGRFLDFLLSSAGRQSLMLKNLVIDSAAGTFDSDAEEASLQQTPIPLGPELLVALDQMKLDRFLARWRQTFAR